MKGSAHARWRTGLMLAPALSTVAVLFGGALVGAVEQSVQPPLGGGISTWSWTSWSALFADPEFTDALWFSARVTALATLISAALALVVAGPLRRAGSAARSLFVLPVPVPHLIVAASAVLWLGPGGLADRALGSLPVDLVRDPAGIGIVLVYVYKETPFLVLLVLAAAGRSLQQREEAAAVLGASPWQRLRWVVWPGVRGPLSIGSLIVAAFVFGAFEVPLAVGPNYPSTIAVYAYEATQNDALSGNGRAAAALLIAAVVSLLAAVGVVRLARTGIARG
ncbi:MAG: ABC transporter permease [Solirubrobacterales bacterium]